MDTGRPGIDNVEDDEKIRQLLKVQPPGGTKTGLTDKVMRRTRAGVGQRDTLLFAIVRIWKVIAELLAPLFAQLAVRQATLAAGRSSNDSTPKPSEDSSAPTNKGA